MKKKKRPQGGVLFEKKKNGTVESDVGSDLTFCAEVCCGKRKRGVTAGSASGNASDRGGGGAQPAVTLPPVVELPSQVGRRGKRSGRSQSHHALPGRPLLLSKHANIHSSEMLKVVTGGRTHDNRPLHPRSPTRTLLSRLSLQAESRFSNEKQ